MSVFESCVEQFGSSVLSIELLQCVSDGSEAGKDDVAAGVDSFYLLFAGALVFFMQIGFAMLLAGSIREKNVSNVLLWNLLDSAGGALAFWATGYAFAYGGDDNTMPKTFVGSSGFFLASSEIDYHFWFFQYTFSCAVSSIVAGAIAERTKMAAYLFYSFFLVGFVYPVIAHAYWSTNGFLSAFAGTPLFGQGIIDLAGSGPVHLVGGAAALVMTVILGPRKGRFYDDEGILLDEPTPMGPHSVTLMFLGTFGLWFGWYGFNPGSVLLISSEQLGTVAGLVAVNTTLGAAGGVLSGMFTSTILDERKTGLHTWDTTASMNGCLTGLVGITAGCATVEPYAAFAIGVTAGWIYIFASKLLIRLKIDDAVDAVPVHMFGGAWGVIACGFFSNPYRMAMAGLPTNHVGLFYGGDGVLLGIQIIGVLVIFGWCFAVFAPFCLALKFMNLLRIESIEEDVGMDISRHKGPAYRVHSVDDNAIDTLNLIRRKLVVEPDSDPVKEQSPEVQAESLASAEDKDLATFIKNTTN